MLGQKFEIGEIVWFQAYADHEPIKGRIAKKGTLAKLNRTFLPSKDERIFYELHVVEEESENQFKQTPFTVTTSRWMKKV